MRIILILIDKFYVKKNCMEKSSLNILQNMSFNEKYGKKTKKKTFTIMKKCLNCKEIPYKRYNLIT